MLVDLERDNAKCMRGELQKDMQNPHSPAVRHFRGQLTTCPNSQVPDPHDYNEAIAAVADCAIKLLENFPREERSRLLSLLSSELGWRSWKIGNVKSRTSTGTVFRATFFLESMSMLLSLRTCEGHQKEDECKLHRAFLLCCVFRSCLPDVMSLLRPFFASLDSHCTTYTALASFSFRQEQLTVLQRSLRKRTE